MKEEDRESWKQILMQTNDPDKNTKAIPQGKESLSQVLVLGFLYIHIEKQKNNKKPQLW